MTDTATGPRLPPIAAAAREAGLDGWLLYDFRGQNPLAGQLLGLPGAHLSRRWFLFVPAQGTPTLIHHRIEAGAWGRILAGEPLERRVYSSHQELDALLRETLAGARRVAMEYSPRGAVPFVSRVDAGTLERVREHVEVVSSADLLQGFLAWSPQDRREHDRAAQGVVRAKDLAFQLMHNRLRLGEPVSELEVQATIVDAFHEAGLVFDHAPNVSFGSHAGDPHYEPSAATDRQLTPGTVVLVDLYAAVPGHPYADVTWMGFAGEPTPEFMRVWDAVRDARDAALETLRSRHGELEGWEVDRVARDLIEARGYGEAFIHRVGHHLGVATMHGPGVNLDDLESHDTRRLLPGLAVTVEPGVYLPEFGVRSEVNVYLAPEGPVVTTPIQEGPTVLGLEYLHERLGEPAP